MTQKKDWLVVWNIVFSSNNCNDAKKNQTVSTHPSEDRCPINFAQQWSMALELWQKIASNQATPEDVASRSSELLAALQDAEEPGFFSEVGPLG